jgi:hypothetical protein
VSRAVPAAEDVPAIPIQINALQAMCRQVFGFRLAMIALAAPAALLNAGPGLATRRVAAAVVVTFMGSYVLFRDWERFGPLLLRHPSLLAVDTLFGSLLLISAGPDTTLAYVSVCTPLLAGLVYGWRGAAVFASLQSLILLLVYATAANLHAGVAEASLLPGLCVIAGAVGSSLRNLMLRFGTATQALTAVQARLAVTEAVSAERARLAREMHDSVAKTLHGVALAADGLAGSAGAERMDAALVKQQAALPPNPGNSSPTSAATPTPTTPRTYSWNSPPAPGTSADAPVCPPSTAKPARRPSHRSHPPWRANSSPSPRRPWRTPTVTRSPLVSTSTQVSTATSSVSACTTTAEVSRRERPSNSCAGPDTSDWSAWSSGPLRWAPGSA